MLVVRQVCALVVRAPHTLSAVFVPRMTIACQLNAAVAFASRMRLIIQATFAKPIQTVLPVNVWPKIAFLMLSMMATTSVRIARTVRHFCARTALVPPILLVIPQMTVAMHQIVRQESATPLSLFALLTPLMLHRTCAWTDRIVHPVPAYPVLA